MPWTSFRRIALVAGLVFGWIAAAGAALPKSEAPPGPTSLAGQLLIASPAIGDPRFARTVILLVGHTKDGAMGIIINRPIEDMPLAELLRSVGEDGAGAEGSVPIFAGGPVSTASGFILHSADYERPGTRDIDGRVAMTSTADILRDIARHAGPAKSLIAFGYAGWGPGQLDAEFARHDWFTAPDDPALVFDADRDSVWDIAMTRRALPP